MSPRPPVAPLERDLDDPPSLVAERLAADSERIEEEQYQLQSEIADLMLRGREMRRNGASDQDLSGINEQLGVLDARRRALPSPLEMQLLKEQQANAELGWTLLPDGSSAKAFSNGHRVISAYSSIVEMQDSDGTVYRETAEDRRQQAERHRPHVAAFKAAVTRRRLSAARSTCTIDRPTRSARTTVRARARRGASRVTATRGPPDEDPDEPPSSPPPRADHLLRDVGDYLRRLDHHGADRSWLIEQLSYLGYPAERVGAALSLAVVEGRARRGRVDDVDTIWPTTATAFTREAA